MYQDHATLSKKKLIKEIEPIFQLEKFDSELTSILNLPAPVLHLPVNRPEKVNHFSPPQS